jgi:hypothetical protein
MKITVHIERVVLDGVPVEQPRLLRSALERELKERLREGGLSPELRQDVAVPYVGGGAISIARKQPAARLGSQIAGAVYRGIGVGR